MRFPTFEMLNSIGAVVSDSAEIIQRADGIALLASDKKVQNYLKNGRELLSADALIAHSPAKTDCEEIDTPGCVAFDKVYTR